MAKRKPKKKISAKSAIIVVASLAVVGSFIPSENSPELDSGNDTQIVETMTEDTKQSKKEETTETRQEPEEQNPDSEPPEQTEPEQEPDPEPDKKPESKPEKELDPEESTEPEPPEEPEPEPEPEVDPEQAFRDKLNQYKYVGSSESDKYHKPKCRWTSEINDENLVHFDTEEEAAAAGYKPCGTCKP